MTELTGTTKNRKSTARAAVLTTVLTVLVALGSPGAAEDIDVGGSLSSTGQTTCSATAYDRGTTTDAAGISIEIPVTISEDNNLEDQWSASMNVVWTSWPTEADPLNGNRGGSPGGNSDSYQMSDAYGYTDSANTELSASWTASNFELNGEYKASVTVQVEGKDRGWGTSTWTTRCNDTSTVTVTIDWTGSDEGEEDDNNVQEVLDCSEEYVENLLSSTQPDPEPTCVEEIEL